MYLLFIGLVFGFSVTGDGQKCKNEYRNRFSKTTIKYGRQARVMPDRDVYYPEDVVRFRCPLGYHFQSLYYRGHEEMWIKCLRGHRWLEDWPICRGPLENVTCENEYMFAAYHGRHWQNATVNQFHAVYSPRKMHYKYGEALRFTCPRGSWLAGTKGLTVMATKCLHDTKWSQTWPMCKGQTCSSLYIKNGAINDEGKKLSVGVTLQITCNPGFYLYGPNTTTCRGSLRWSGHPQECVTLTDFRTLCEKDNKVMRKDRHSGRLYCYYPERKVYASNHYKIAVGISVPMAVGFIIFIVTASLYVKHQRIKMQRERELYRRQEQRNNMLLKSLPSYDEAIKNVPTAPPPTFDETFADDAEQEHHLLFQGTSSPTEHTSSTSFTDAVVEFPPRYTESPPSYDDDEDDPDTHHHHHVGDTTPPEDRDTPSTPPLPSYETATYNSNVYTSSHDRVVEAEGPQRQQQQIVDDVVDEPLLPTTEGESNQGSDIAPSVQA